MGIDIGIGIGIGMGMGMGRLSEAVAWPLPPLLQVGLAASLGVVAHSEALEHDWVQHRRDYNY